MAQESDFSKGEKFFRQNRPEEAVYFLENSLTSDQNPKAYTYLALAYSQLGRNSDALRVCSTGMKVPGTNKKILAYNAGNICFTQGNFKDAEEWFSLSIASDPSYPDPVLNRANSRMKQGSLEDAVVDYKNYLLLAPDNPQRREILKLISLIEEEMALREEEKRLRLAEEERLRQEEKRLAEERARRLEMERLEAERRAAQEAERRRKLLEEVAASLQSTETENMSAGTEGTVDYEYDTELE